jgi:hypothetical protein
MNMPKNRGLVIVVAVLAASLLVVGAAFAGKALDDKLKEVTAAYKAPLDEIKTACGCTLKVTTSGYKNPDDCNRIADAITSVATAAKAYCAEDKYKKAFCAKVKAISVTFTKDDVGDPKLKGTTLELKSNSAQYNGDNQITPILDGLAE